jgi:AcrR family transcriptional regulator
MAPAAPAAGTAAIEELVVDAALAIAAEEGWERLRLHAVADRTGLPLAEIGRRFRDVDAVANAWFGQARHALLAMEVDELAGRAADERVALALGVWLDSLAPHRRLAGEVLRHKLHPSHPHHWVPMVFDLSRLVHDLLDVARVAGSGRLRQAQEVGLTAIALLTLADWLRDDSPAQERSKRRLGRRLAIAGRLARWLDSAAERASPPAPGEAAPATAAPSSPPRPRRRPASRA